MHVINNNFNNILYLQKGGLKMGDPNKEVTSVICEQGDLGLFGDPLTEADQAKYDEQQQSEEKKDK